MAWSLKRAILGPPKPQVYKSEAELFAGVPKPSSLLMGMIIAKMQESLVKASVSGDSYPLKGCEGNQSRFEWEDDKIKVGWKYVREENYRGETISYSFRGITINLGGTPTEFNSSEMEQFYRAAKKMMEMKNEFERHQAENKRQMTATNLIEEFFKPKPLPIPEVDSPPAPLNNANTGVDVKPTASMKRGRKTTTVEEVNQLSAMIS